LVASALVEALTNGEDRVVLILTLWDGAKGTPMRLSFALLLVVYDDIFSIELRPPPCLFKIQEINTDIYINEKKARGRCDGTKNPP